MQFKWKELQYNSLDLAGNMKILTSAEDFVHLGCVSVSVLVPSQLQVHPFKNRNTLITSPLKGTLFKSKDFVEIYTILHFCYVDFLYKPKKRNRQ